MTNAFDVAYDGGIESGLCAMTHTSGFGIDSSLCAMTHASDVMMKYCTVLHPGNMYYRTVSVIFRVSVQCRKNEMPCSAKLVVHGPPKGPNKSVSNSIILGTTGAARAHQKRSAREAPFMHFLRILGGIESSTNCFRGKDGAHFWTFFWF